MQPDSENPKRNQPVAKLLRNVHTTVDIEAKVDADAVATGLNLSTAQRAEFEQRLKETRHWLQADPKLLEQFRSRPLDILEQRFPGLSTRIPKDLLDSLDQAPGAPCAGAPAPGLYNACALDLLQRVAAWAGQGPTYRATFVSDPDVAVDAVAGTSPIEARLLVKAALRAARTYP